MYVGNVKEVEADAALRNQRRKLWPTIGGGSYTKTGMDAPYQFLSAASASEFGLQFPPPILAFPFPTLFIRTACTVAAGAAPPPPDVDVDVDAGGALKVKGGTAGSLGELQIWPKHLKPGLSVS